MIKMRSALVIASALIAQSAAGTAMAEEVFLKCTPMDADIASFFVMFDQDRNVISTLNESGGVGNVYCDENRWGASASSVCNIDENEISGRVTALGDTYWIAINRRNGEYSMGQAGLPIWQGQCARADDPRPPAQF